MRSASDSMVSASSSVDNAAPPAARDILPDHVESFGADEQDQDALPDDTTQGDLADLANAVETDRERDGDDNDVPPVPRTREDLPDRPLTGDQGDKAGNPGGTTKG